MPRNLCRPSWQRYWATFQAFGVGQLQVGYARHAGAHSIKKSTNSEFFGRQKKIHGHGKCEFKGTGAQVDRYSVSTGGPAFILKPS